MCGALLNQWLEVIQLGIDLLRSHVSLRTTTFQ